MTNGRIDKNRLDARLSDLSPTKVQQAVERAVSPQQRANGTQPQQGEQGR